MVGTAGMENKRLDVTFNVSTAKCNFTTNFAWRKQWTIVTRKPKRNDPLRNLFLREQFVDRLNSDDWKALLLDNLTFMRCLNWTRVTDAKNFLPIEGWYTKSRFVSFEFSNFPVTQDLINFLLFFLKNKFSSTYSTKFLLHSYIILIKQRAPTAVIM